MHCFVALTYLADVECPHNDTCAALPDKCWGRACTFAERSGPLPAGKLALKKFLRLVAEANKHAEVHGSDECCVQPVLRSQCIRLRDSMEVCHVNVV